MAPSTWGSASPPLSAPSRPAAVVAAAQRPGYDAWIGGWVRKDGQRKAVEVPPLGLVFEGDTLQVR